MIMKKIAFATLVAMGMTATAIAQQQPAEQPAPRSTQPSAQQPTQPSTATPAPHGGDRTEQASFETVDTNGDGRVNRQEASHIDGFDFSRADTNNDAALTRQEFMAAMSTSTPRDGAAGSASARSGAAAGSSTAQNNPGAASATSRVTFDTADKNKDGKVSRDEGAAVQGLNFSTADVNADASLSRQEFQTAMAGVQPRG